MSWVYSLWLNSWWHPGTDGVIRDEDMPEELRPA